MARPDSTLPPISTPNFSFNPGPAVSTGPAQIALESQAAQRQQNQQSQDSILKTVQMASQLAQSFVEMSKQRQQRDAIQAYAAFNPNQSVTRTTPGGDQTGIADPMHNIPSSVIPSSSLFPGMNLNPGQPTAPSVPQTTQTTLGQTPEGRAMQQQLLARVLATNPQSASADIAKQAFPAAPTTIEGLLARGLQNTGATPQAAVETKQSLLKPGHPTSVQGTIDGKDAFANYDHGKYTDPATGADISANFKPRPQGSNAIADTRLKLGVQASLTNIAKEMKATLVDSQPAKTVLSSDNFLNQVKRAADGKIILDKSTVTAMSAELDRALTGTGVISEQRAKELAPASLQSKWADIKGYVLNHPEDRDVQSFFNNLAEEVKGRREQSLAAVEQSLKPFMASAKLAQREDPQGFKDTIESIGLDSEAAKTGKIKFLPGAKSVLYGLGNEETGLKPQPAQTTSTGWTSDKEKRYQELKAKYGSK